MVDNVTFQTTPATAPNGTVVATDNIGGIDYQRVKVTWGVDGTATDVSATDPLPVTSTPSKSSTGTQSNVAGNAGNVTILAANTSRRGASVYNDSAAILYLLAAAGTSSATLYTVQIQPNGYYEVPASYTGIISGIWASATGSARVTEWT